MRLEETQTILTCPDRNNPVVRITADNGLIGYGDAGQLADGLVHRQLHQDVAGGDRLETDGDGWSTAGQVFGRAIAFSAPDHRSTEEQG